ncbi:hypothetical protein HPB48_016033 [Haemaphysalis longicornis]|uniref:Uncharacterized protein n=1 Tax=Haemaphysalis longicornis TaxID=44386 RepID=A0A9J6FCW6_HAELO|nr:hypothetical protein HPB48_016033 [Haemaphysalis longicornis]
MAPAMSTAAATSDASGPTPTGAAGHHVAEDAYEDSTEMDTTPANSPRRRRPSLDRSSGRTAITVPGTDDDADAGPRADEDAAPGNRDRAGWIQVVPLRRRKNQAGKQGTHPKRAPSPTGKPSADSASQPRTPRQPTRAQFANKVNAVMTKTARMPNFASRDENRVVVRPRGGLVVGKVLLTDLRRAVFAAAGVDVAAMEEDSVSPNGGPEHFAHHDRAALQAARRATGTAEEGVGEGEGRSRLRGPEAYFDHGGAPRAGAGSAAATPATTGGTGTHPGQRQEPQQPSPAASQTSPTPPKTRVQECEEREESEEEIDADEDDAESVVSSASAKATGAAKTPGYAGLSNRCRRLENQMNRWGKDLENMEKRLTNRIDRALNQMMQQVNQAVGQMTQLQQQLQQQFSPENMKTLEMNAIQEHFDNGASQQHSP